MVESAVNPHKGWDWPLLYYAATAVLNMTPRTFWKTTPRKLVALIHVHSEVNSGEPHEDEWTETPTGYIDNVM